jgi:hypothetical protein
MEHHLPCSRSAAGSRLAAAFGATLLIVSSLAGCPQDAASGADAGFKFVINPDAGLEPTDAATNPTDSGYTSPDGFDAGPQEPYDAGHSDGGGNGPPHQEPCGAATQFIYVVGADNKLYRFFPPSLTFNTVGTVNCQELFFSPFSMAVDRMGQIFVLSVDGKLWSVNPNTAACTATTFTPNQHSFMTFGMGYSSNTPGSDIETLFVSSDNGLGLATIDTTSFTLHPIATYTGLTGNGVTGRAELTGNGDAGLYGAFEGAPFEVAQIDKTNAAILSEAPQPPVSTGGSGGSNFAFAAWGGDFYLFVGPGSYTDVYLYKPGGGTTMVTSTTAEIVGAGVSTCAP